MSRPVYIPELDSVRGIAAFGVLLFHVYPQSLFWGWLLVDLFFVLSGFLITRLLLVEKDSIEPVLKKFWISRAARIWPIYYVVLIAQIIKISIGNWLQLNEVDIQSGSAWSLVFLQDIPQYWGNSSGDPVLGFGHSWSLAVEEQFYFLWPFIILPFRHRLKWPVIIGSLLLITAITIRHFVGSPFVLLTRMDGIALGALLAIDERTNGRWRAGLGGRLVLIGLVGWALYVVVDYLCAGYQVPNLSPVWGTTYHWQESVTAFSILFSVVVYVLVRYTGSIVLAIMRLRLLRYLGSISYAVYMLHIPLIAILVGHNVRIGADWSLIDTLLLFFLTIALAHLMKLWIEIPVQRWKRRFLNT